jgi:hypothetical protein
MSLGSLVLRFRQRFRHGLRVSYWRDVVRPRILRTRPVIESGDGKCEIHVMTCAADWLNLMWAVKSFYWASGRKYSLCIHDDGSLMPEHVEILTHHFPASRIVRRSDADDALGKTLAAYPRCESFRKTNVLAPKVFDFPAFLGGERMLLLDSDLLFFGEPVALLRAVEDGKYRTNLFNADCDSAYTVEPDAVKSLAALELKPRINSGLALIHRDSLRLEWIEEFLALPGILDGHFWRIEQTIYALCSSRYGVELLPPEYQVKLTKGLAGLPCRHYVGAIRHWMYGEGLPQLVRRGMLRDLRNGSSGGGVSGNAIKTGRE